MRRLRDRRRFHQRQIHSLPHRPVRFGRGGRRRDERLRHRNVHRKAWGRGQRRLGRAGDQRRIATGFPPPASRRLESGSTVPPIGPTMRRRPPPPLQRRMRRPPGPTSPWTGAAADAAVRALAARPGSRRAARGLARARQARPQTMRCSGSDRVFSRSTGASGIRRSSSGGTSGAIGGTGFRCGGGALRCASCASSRLRCSFQRANILAICSG